MLPEALPVPRDSFTSAKMPAKTDAGAVVPPTVYGVPAAVLSLPFM